MYSLLDVKTAIELDLRRKGWFSPEYELTDGAYSYGKLAYTNLSTWRASAVAATGTWTFLRDGIFGRTISITSVNGELTGQTTRDLLRRRVVLTLQNGFRAEFYRTSFLSREYAWVSEEYGTILRIKSSFLSLRATVYVDQSMAPAAVIPLLIFLGEHLIIVRRRRRQR